MLKISIQTNADFTPRGRRSVRIVKTRSVMGEGRQLRLYVSGRRYRVLPVTPENVAMAREWLGCRMYEVMRLDHATRIA